MTGLPECFTKKQEIYLSNKLQLLKIFDSSPSLTSSLKKDALILDFSVIVNSQAAVTTAKTFNEFADEVIEFVKNLSSGCSHIDIVCDSYFDNSLKSHTREARGCGQFFPFTEATNIPKDFQDNFLRHNGNKVALNSFLTGKLFTHDFDRAVVFVSVNSEVKCNSADVSEEVIHIGHTQKVADAKIIVHVKHCLLNGFRNVVVKTVDTDVVTLLLAHLSLLNSPYEIEVDFNFGKDRMFYKINDTCSRITSEQQLALLFFFTFTGWNITSLFFDIKKYLVECMVPEPLHH